ncbi:class I SAM-dependent methyltransferase [Patescibacteria group bacterium]|nr:class I SAM-dependent methyltransferase [Patescibacteria group bacterium]
MNLKQLVQEIAPKKMMSLMSSTLKQKIDFGFAFKELPSYSYFSDLMKLYQTKDLVNVDSDSFQKKIENFPIEKEVNKDDPEKTDALYPAPFKWGHNHDFGTFAVKGRMKDRHLWLFSMFVDKFGALPKSLEGKRVLDIGPWTGGTTLLLCAMGAEVVAIEPIKKSVDYLNYLKNSFDIKNLEVKNMSLFECDTPEFQDSFDYVLCTGTLYYVTDIPLGLRILYNSLKDGGTLLFESLASNSKNPIFAYRVPEPPIFKKTTFPEGGWEWLMPSPSALDQVLKDVGYENVQVSKVLTHRVLAVAKRNQHKKMIRGGMSKPIR